MFLFMDIDVQTTVNNDEMAYKGVIWNHSENFFTFLYSNTEAVYQMNATPIHSNILTCGLDTHLGYLYTWN
jgi:hypothetical protein